MRACLLITALLFALALPAAASAAGPADDCAKPTGAGPAPSAVRSIGDTPRADAAGNPLLRIVPVAQYACSNRCRRGCYRALQSCRASRRTCQRRLSACIRRCGC